jgi:hypothetical protein
MEDLTISIYPDQRFEEATQLRNGHEVNRFLTENVEGWKGDPESGGTMMYFEDDQVEESKEMRKKVHEALIKRYERMKEIKKEIERYRR